MIPLTHDTDIEEHDDEDFLCVLCFLGQTGCYSLLLVLFGPYIFFGNVQCFVKSLEPRYHYFYTTFNTYVMYVRGGL
jgi:hypothetical protein